MKHITEEVHTPEIDEIDSFLTDIYELRRTGLASEGEYGTGNLVFKELRNKGYLDKLKELKNKLIGDELSLESYAEGYDLDEVSDNAQSRLALYKRKATISRIANFCNTVVRASGAFTIYNVKPEMADHILRRLRELDYVEEAHKVGGGADYNKTAIYGGQHEMIDIVGKMTMSNKNTTKNDDDTWDQWQTELNSQADENDADDFYYDDDVKPADVKNTPAEVKKSPDVKVAEIKKEQPQNTDVFNDSEKEKEDNTTGIAKRWDGDNNYNYDMDGDDDDFWL